jgi:hypothetical protein
MGSGFFALLFSVFVPSLLGLWLEIALVEPLRNVTSHLYIYILSIFFY